MNGTELKAGDPIGVLIGTTVCVLPRRNEQEASRSVNVNELKWPDALNFGRLLAERVSNLIAVNEAGQPVFDMAKIREAIPMSGELAEFLVTRATGLKPEEIAQLHTSDFLELLAVAMEVNLSEEVLGKFKRVAGIAQRSFGAAKTPSPAPSTS